MILPAPPTIYILTDFGTADQYVAVMKAVVLARCGDARLVDITHEVPPQAVDAGAYLLESTWPWLPPGSIVLAVVDPGVGTQREAAVFYHEDKWLVGPNNGLFSFLPPDTKGRLLDKPQFWLKNVSGTFHGRDVFAPCAAHLAAGGDWTDLGDKPAVPLRLDGATTPAISGKISGHIIHFDHFGNAITSLRCESQHTVGVVEIPGHVRCPVSKTYSDVEPGKIVAYVGSTGRLELAIKDGNAQKNLSLQTGDHVYLEPGEAIK